MTISDSFASILNRCDFSAHDRDALATHRREVETRLKNSFEVSKIELVGSYARGSAIRQTSDTDLLVVLRKAELDWAGSRVSSTTVMGKVRQEMVARFPSTAIGRDGQAVVVTFADERSIDVVPATWIRAQPDGWPLYAIPDGAGGWMHAAPDSHNRYIADADARSGGKLKNVARTFRYWKASRQEPVPISSFYVELLMAADNTCPVGRSYADCFAALLSLLARRECRGLHDPIGISGTVNACGTESKRLTALRTVLTSSERAAAALAAERSGNPLEARRLWNLVFNEAFPR